ncbi:MAG: response regulator transcription factor [Lewinellaceae bacterium]|nr:response regulator transcription factor [Phaeodactylibacter sp.]MCB9348620.1 response regulator transcription factor [Lewinellaceae bacterium]
MKVIIIEDEAIAADRLEKQLNEISPDMKVLAKLGSIKESVKWLTTHSADLIFLDIQLSDGLSFSIFEQVQVQTPVILTTAYDQYAIKAFQLNSVSYLLKPIRKSELMESLQKFQSLRTAFNINFDHLVSMMQSMQPTYRQHFLIQVGEKFRQVQTDEAAYFFAAHKAVFLRTFQGKTYPLDLALDALEQSLDPARFFRINRKYLVSMQAIAKMIAWSRSRIKIELAPPADDSQDTIVSIDRAKDFKDWMDT